MSTPRSLLCLFVTLSAVASGCGGSSTTTVNTRVGTSAPTASAPAVTSAPAGESPHTASQSTKATPPKTTTAEPPEQTTRPSAPESKAAKPGSETGPLKVPAKRRYGFYVAEKFVATCVAAKGSPASCECVIAEQELHYVIKGLSFAEVIAVELAMQQGSTFAQAAQHRVKLPKGVQRSIDLCKNRKK